MGQDVRMKRRIAGMLRKRLDEARFAEVPDTRRARGRRWQLDDLLRTVLYGICAGSTSLQQTETLTDEMSPAMRSRLRVRRRVPDTTLRSALITVAPMSLRPSLHAVVRAAHRRKALEPDALPFGVVSLDGKATALPSCDDELAQRQSQPDNHHVIGLLRTMTATLTSSAARPCIDVMSIHASTNEMGTFAHALQAAFDAYGTLDLFRLVSYDSGACSEHNAAFVRKLGLHYLFGLKGTQPTLLAEAERLLGSLAPSAAVATTTDKAGTSTVVRRLFITEEMAAFGSFEHVHTVARVDSETINSFGRRVSSERRYFISSLHASRLTHDQWLRVVRGHWGVETTHQILDVALQEDDHPWITANPRGALVVAVLRRIAYTLLALFRSVSLRSDAARHTPWRSLLQQILFALVAASEPDLAGLRRHHPAPS